MIQHIGKEVQQYYFESYLGSCYKWERFCKQVINCYLFTVFMTWGQKNMAIENLNVVNPKKERHAAGSHKQLPCASSPFLSFLCFLRPSWGKTLLRYWFTSCMEFLSRTAHSPTCHSPPFKHAQFHITRSSLDRKTSPYSTETNQVKSSQRI